MPAANTVVPVLRVTEIEQSRQFYEQGLGFTVDWLWRPEEGGPAFAQISRDSLRIYLSEDKSAAGGMLYLYVDNVDAWYKELLKNSVAVQALPHDEYWGNREMSLLDPDGNQLQICTPINKKHSC